MAGIDHRAEDGLNQVSGFEGVSHRYAAHAVGLTDHAAAVESATEQHLGGPLLNLVQGTDLSGEIHLAIEAVQSGEQFAPLKKSVA